MKRVLIVEDDANERFTLGRVLERVGYAVTAVSTADEAIAALPGADFHAVVSDVIMPEVDGVSLARSIAEHSPGTPVILISACHIAPRQFNRMRIGALHFLDKPIDIPQLLAVLESPNGGPVARGETLSVAEALRPDSSRPRH